jgi:hypothetical protein
VHPSASELCSRVPITFMTFMLVAFAGSARMSAMPFQLCLSAANQCVASPYQFMVTPTLQDAKPNEMGFLFQNQGPLASSITAIYFESGFASIFTGPIRVGSSSAGVKFSAAEPTNKVTPPDLPDRNATVGGGFTVAKFDAITNGTVKAIPLAADSDSPTQPNGINPGEQLFLYLTFLPGQQASGPRFMNNVDRFNVLLWEKPTRIGIHVQGMAGDKSAAYITPEPMSYGLGITIGTGLFILCSRRRQQARP